MMGENKIKQQSCEGSITLKVVPAYKNTRGISQVFLRCHYNYSPKSDDLFPTNGTGVSFKERDILEVVDQSDPDWWQAFHIGDTNDKTGLIPSLKFEQTRRASITPLHKEAKVHKLFNRNKKKILYKTSHNSVFDCLDVQLYEEVTKMPPMERKVIVLVGAQGVGRRTLKNRLLTSYPDRFATTIPETSRPPRDGEVSGRGYIFLDREEIKRDVACGKYFEWGESCGHTYGTKLNAIRDITDAGKICIIDCNPSALKLLKTAEFMPLIVFVEAPKLEVLSRMNQKEGDTKKRTISYISLNICTEPLKFSELAQFKVEELKETISESGYIRDNYHHYFDLSICNDDFDKSYNTLREYYEQLSNESQWVPISWVF